MTEVTDAMLEDIERLAKVITPLPYFLIPERLDNAGQPMDAQITFGNPNNGHESWDLIEHYEAHTDYPYIVAACNASPALVAEIRRLRQRVNELEEAAKSEFQRGYTMGKDSK